MRYHFMLMASGFLLGVSTCLAVQSCESTCKAGNCHVARVVNRNVVVANAVVVPANFVAVAYAVPVATPAYIGYQYPQYQATVGFGSAAVGYGSAAVGHPEPQREPVRALAGPEPEEAPLPMSLVAQNCARCHKPKGSAWAKTQLDVTGELSSDDRLHMIQRILSDDPKHRMPRGKEIDAQTRGELIQELSSVPTPAPPKPEPEK